MTVESDEHALRFRVKDDGAGFDATSDVVRGHGFVNMADRLGAIGGSLDVDSNPEVSIKFGIRSIPTLMVFKGGKVVEQIIGAVPKRNLIDKVIPHISVN